MIRIPAVQIAGIFICWAAFFANQAALSDEKLDAWKASFDSDILPIIGARCLECHNNETAEGEFSLSAFTDGAAAAEKLDLWDRVGKRIRLNEMPPQGSPGLSDPQKGAFYRWLDSRPKQDLCNQLASDETQAWYKGHVMSRRLTRTEYLFAIEDLLGIPLPEDIGLPSDGSGGEGFDTAGDALYTSPLHIESFLRAASWAIDSISENTSSPHWVFSNTVGADSEASDGISRDDAREIIQRFCHKAWRTPVASEDIDRLMTLFDTTMSRGKPSREALAMALKAILVSPQFLFVVERESPEGGVQRLSAHELAMRLSLFIWSSIPDGELLSLADSGALNDQQILRQQVQRMLSDERSNRIGENFGLQWLGLADLIRKAQPDAEVFPDFDRSLLTDLRQEAIMMVAAIFREDRPLTELINGDSIIINQRLAKHYAVDEIEKWFPSDSEDSREAWKRIETADGRRGGVLTLGAVLVNTSYPRRTSPVLRGQWVLAEVLGAKVPPPPPGVPALEESNAALSAKTMRERLEIHRSNEQCASCHNLMDPLGFGLENYDALGRWRDQDNGQPIDASGTTPSGQSFLGPAGLKQIVTARQDEFRKHVVRKLLGFALGRELNKFDQCVIDDCLTRLDENDQRAACVIETICLSFPFQHRYFKPRQEPQ